MLKNSFADLFEEVGQFNDSIHLAYESIGGSEFKADFNKMLTNYLNFSQESYKQKYGEASRALEQKYEDLLTRFDGDNDRLLAFKQRHTNKKMETLVRDKYSLHKTYVFDNHIFQGDEPVFRQPAQANGSAHFYASYKLLGNWRIDTIFYNIGVMWLLTFILMVALYFDLLRKALTYVENWRLARQARMRDHIFYNPMAFMKGELKDQSK